MIHLAITGIGGFIGLHMTRRALALGWTVSGIDISAEGVAQAQALGATAIQGDINDQTALQEAFAGADWIFHTAAVVQEDGPEALYEQVNNQGTASVCKAALAQGVPRLLHLSSVMVYDFHYPANVTESGPFKVQGNLYNETKLSSERIALSYNDKKLTVTVIRPGDVYGSGSVPWILRPLEAAQQNMLILPNGGRGIINPVHIDNLIDGVLLAWEKDPGAGVFNITDDLAVPAKEFFSWHQRWGGQKLLLSLPLLILKPALMLMVIISKLLGKTPLLQPAALDFLNRPNKVSCDKAKQELGYAPRISLTQGMQQIEAELRAEDKL